MDQNCKCFFNYDIWNLVVNIFVALGTCGATWLALYPRKNKEKLEGVYWIYYNLSKTNAQIIVNVKNKGSNNCIFDEDSTLMFMRDKESIIENHNLIRRITLPPKCSYSFVFNIKQSEYLSGLENMAKLSCCINTKNGTIINLVKGMKTDPQPVELD